MDYMCFSSMLDFTVLCGNDQQTFAIYINGTWVVNTTFSPMPYFYHYEILPAMENQARFYTTYVRYFEPFMSLG